MAGLITSGIADLKPKEKLLYLFVALTAAAIPVSIAVSQLLLAAAFCCWIWCSPKSARQALLLPIGWPLLLCFLTTLLAVMGSGDPLVSAGALKKFSLFLIPYVSLAVFRNERRIAIVLALMLFNAGVSALLAFVQYPSSGPLNRVSGFLGHWQTFSGQMMIGMLIAAALLFWASRCRWLCLVPLLLCGTGLLLSETRGAWLGCIAALLFMAVARDRRIVAGLLMVLAIGFLFLPGHLKERAYSIVDLKMESNAARLNMWATGLRMIKAHPFFGVGPNRITALAYDYGGNPRYEPRFFMHLHNNILQLAAERGIPGLLAWVWLVGRFYLDLAGFLQTGNRKAEGLQTAIIWASLASLTGILVAGMMEFNLGDSEVLMMLLMLLSCAYALCWRPVISAPQLMPTIEH